MPDPGSLWIFSDRPPSEEILDLAERLVEAMTPELEGATVHDALSAILHAAMQTLYGCVEDNEPEHEIAVYTVASAYFRALADRCRAS